MNNNEILHCTYCKYTTNRNYNLNRHQINKHSKELMKSIQNNNVKKYIESNEKNTASNEKNNAPNEKGTCCLKCNKKYLTIKSLKKHEEKCNGVDILTCPKCMKSFANSSCKSHHIKRDTCKPRSILHARTPNIQNITNNTDNSIINNNNTTNNNITNNIININNYGNERLDYINYDKYLSIFKKNYDIPSALTEEIHFNPDFPENNNILYNDKTTLLVKSNNNYLEKDTKLFVEELINNKSKIIQRFAHTNKTNICENMSCALYDEIIELLLKLIVKEPISQYNKQTKKIMDLIRNNKV